MNHQFCFKASNKTTVREYCTPMITMKSFCLLCCKGRSRLIKKKKKGRKENQGESYVFISYYFPTLFPPCWWIVTLRIILWIITSHNIILVDSILVKEYVYHFLNSLHNISMNLLFFPCGCRIKFITLLWQATKKIKIFDQK